MKFLLLGLLLSSPVLAQKKESHFQNAKSDIQSVLSSPAFKEFSDYTILSIRNGEGPDQAQTYFVALEKPFAKDAKTCLMFQSTNAKKWTQKGKPGDCKD